MDQTAVTLCKENTLPLIVLNIHRPGAIARCRARRTRRHPRPMSTIPQIMKDARAAMDKGIDSVEARVRVDPLRQGDARTCSTPSASRCTDSRCMLNQVASIAAPEPRVLLVTPFDKGQVKVDREGDPRVRPRPRAVGAGRRHPRAAAAMNEQRRKELVKVVHKLAEEGKHRRSARAHARPRRAQEAERRERGRREARREGPAEGPRRLHPQDRRADQGERSRDHGSLTRATAPAPMSELARRILFSRRRRPPRAVHRARGGRATCGPARGRERARCVGVLSHRARLGHSCRSTTSASRSPGLLPLAVHAHYLGLFSVRPLARRGRGARHPRVRRSGSRGVEGQAARRRRGDAAWRGLHRGHALVWLRDPLSRRRARLRRGSARFASLGPLHVPIAPGGVLLIFPLVLTWASDIGAYVVGRAIGGRKLIPSVSPGKTVAGAVGGLVVSMVVVLAVRAVRARAASRISASRHGRRSVSAPSSASPRRSATWPSRCSSAKAG